MSDATDNRFYHEAQPPSKEKVPSAKELIDSLARFADHNPLCPRGQWKPQDEEDFDMPECVCGLDLLLDHANVFVQQYEPASAQVVDALIAASHKRCAAGVHQQHLYDAERAARAAVLDAIQPTLEPPCDEHDESGRTGTFTNCGYVGTASGFIVRDGTYWIATFRRGEEADQYVDLRNEPDAGCDRCERFRDESGHYPYCPVGEGMQQGRCSCNERPTQPPRAWRPHDGVEPAISQNDSVIPIEVGVGKVRVAICSSTDDPQQVERELVIYDDGGEPKPVGTDVPEHRGKKAWDVGRILARIRIVNADGALVLLWDLQTVIDNARRADSALTKGCDAG